MSCSAVNCTDRSTRGFRLFRFPSDPKRRKIWGLLIQDETKWVPTGSSRLCDIHFNEEQFETKRLDGIVKLKSNAIPTVFNVPNSPRKTNTTRKSIYGRPNAVNVAINRMLQPDSTCNTVKVYLDRN